MLEKIIKFFFAKRTKKHQSEEVREKRFVNYKNARSIILLFESDYTEKNPEIRKIIQGLNADGKKVMAWGYINKKEITTAILPDFRILHQKDADLFQKPNASFMYELENIEFDLLIDLSINEHIPLQYLCLYAKASCKVGVKKNELGLYDFMIDLQDYYDNRTDESCELEVSDIYNQINFYLKSIQTSD